MSTRRASGPSCSRRTGAVSIGIAPHRRVDRLCPPLRQVRHDAEIGRWRGDWTPTLAHGLPRYGQGNEVAKAGEMLPRGPTWRVRGAKKPRSLFPPAQRPRRCAWNIHHLTPLYEYGRRGATQKNARSASDRPKQKSGGRSGGRGDRRAYAGTPAWHIS
jgi:hypothetical protein